MARRANQLGETLIEILMAVVLIGLVFSAYFVTNMTTSSSTSTVQRKLVTADGLLRDYAEATKAAVRHDCGVSSPTTYTTPTMSAAGFRFRSDSSPAGQNCPAPTSVQRVVLTVTTVTTPTTPTEISRSLEIEVRTP